MAGTEALEARLEVLALAMQCMAASLAPAQAREVAGSLEDGLAKLLAERGQVSAEVDETLAMQAGLLLRSLGRRW